MSRDRVTGQQSDLVDALGLQIAMGVILELNLPDLKERLDRSAHELLMTQPQEMQDDPSNKQFLEAIVKSLMGATVSE